MIGIDMTGKLLLIYYSVHYYRLLSAMEGRPCVNNSYLFKVNTIYCHNINIADQLNLLPWPYSCQLTAAMCIELNEFVLCPIAYLVQVTCLSSDCVH